MRIQPSTPVKGHFSKDERGSTAVMFGLMAVPLVAVIGIALDFSRASNQQQLMQQALDTAVLAAMNTPSADKVAVANKYFAANFPGSIAAASPTFVLGSNGTMTGTVTSIVNMPFASLARLGTVDVNVEASSAPKTGGNKAEVAMMIDLTGSMGATRGGSTKIAGLVTAGNDMLNILFPNGAASSANVRVAIAPMADYVNAGPYASSVTGLAATGSYAKSTNLTNTKQGPFSGTYSGLTSSSSGSQHGATSASASTAGATFTSTFCTPSNNFEIYSGKPVGVKVSWNSAGAVYVTGKWYTKKWEDNRWKYEDQNDDWIKPTPSSTCTEANDQTGPLITCVTERTGSNAYTDASPSTGGYVGPYNQAASGTSNKVNYSGDGKCNVAGRELPAVIPLTNLKSKLTAFFNGPTGSGPLIGGGTPGHLGHAWAWYMLSPNWSSVWPSSSLPAAYTEATTKKYAIIMTDGEYNEQYSSATSKTQALNLCTSMKAKGITVYTVGFGFDNSAIGANTTDGQAKQLLRDCASSNGYFFPYDGAALRTAFQSIGNTIAAGTTGAASETHLTD